MARHWTDNQKEWDKATMEGATSIATRQGHQAFLDGMSRGAYPNYEYPHAARQRMAFKNAWEDEWRKKYGKVETGQ